MRRGSARSAESGPAPPGRSAPDASSVRAGCADMSRSARLPRWRRTRSNWRRSHGDRSPPCSARSCAPSRLTGASEPGLCVGGGCGGGAEAGVGRQRLRKQRAGECAALQLQRDDALARRTSTDAPGRRRPRRSPKPEKWPFGGCCGHATGTMRSTDRLASSTDGHRGQCQRRSATATSASAPGRASGASAKWTCAASSSSASSSMPASAARMRLAGAFGIVRVCQLRSASSMTSTTLSALGHQGRFGVAGAVRRAPVGTPDVVVRCTGRSD